ncbi:uncharacterized protein LOC115537114 isoform X2 [Gadus morhua]|uniref:uncharacterized protein LOC115537114 isoform X2 n=1 Tax=Gadus morhua TaxID=8049 RepID=UPI0011B432E6|nr:ubiquitin thioesterase otulin isoform X2 [Gadus morhua]
MGSCCCHAETPCASLEEKSGLLAGKTAAPPETGIEGAFPDSPTSDGRKASMGEIKEGEMKEEQIKAEEQTSVTAQVRQGENTPSMRQENGVVQKESVCTEDVAPPTRHQSSAGGPLDPQLQPLPAAVAPDVAVTGTVVVATPEKQTTAAVAEERCSPPSTSQEVTDAHCEGERRNSPEGLRKEESPESLLPALGGFSPPKISNTQLLSQPPPSAPQTPTTRAVIPERILEEGSSSPDLQVCSLEPQVCGEVPVGSFVEKIHSPALQVCGDGSSHTVPGLSNTVHDNSLHSTWPSDVLDQETDCPVDSRQSKPTPLEEDLHSDLPSELRATPTEIRASPTELRASPMELSDLPSELRAPNETLEKPPEDEPRPLVTSPSGNWIGYNHLGVNQDQDQQEVVDVQQEAVWKGDGQEEEEEAAGRGMGASIEPMDTSVGGEGKETHTAAGGGEVEMDDEDEETAGEEEEEKEEEEKEEEEGKAEVSLVDQGESDEDIYASKEDMYSSPSSAEVTHLKVEESCSLAPMVDLLSYSQREWRGNTTKSALIRKGYQQMMERFGGVRRVRGDNYCALRATLFQVLSQTTKSPAWLQQDHFTTLPGELEGPDGLLSRWWFPGEYQSGDGQSGVTQRLKGYIELLRKTPQLETVSQLIRAADERRTFRRL